MAGYFYPKTEQALRAELRRLTDSPGRGVPSYATIVPHASFQYSGRVAGETFSRLAIPRRCVILGPNHTGTGASWSLMAAGAYETPLGHVPIDEPLARSLLEACPLVTVDHVAHVGEHAIEVPLPFLQWLGPAGLSIVPLVVGSEDEEECEQVARALAQVIRRTQDPVLLIASSDLTHYEPHETATRKDAQLIAAIQTLDPRRVLEQAGQSRVSLCGPGPVACVVGAARHLGATQAQLIQYATSAAAGGDPQSVVGYAGILLN